MYSFRQKFFSFVVLSCVSWDRIFLLGGYELQFERAELLVDDLPNNFVGRHGDRIAEKQNSRPSRYVVLQLS